MSDRGTACECVIHNDNWPDGAEESLDEDPNTALQCSRPEGHAGVHAACSTTEHPAMAWPNEGAEA